jgi:hypothetical protein
MATLREKILQRRESNVHPGGNRRLYGPEMLMFGERLTVYTLSPTGISAFSPTLLESRCTKSNSLRRASGSFRSFVSKADFFTFTTANYDKALTL